MFSQKVHLFQSYFYCEKLSKRELIIYHHRPDLAKNYTLFTFISGLKNWHTRMYIYIYISKKLQLKMQIKHLNMII